MSSLSPAPNSRSYWWLLISQVVIVLPFLNDLPAWLPLLLLLSAGWRFWVARGHWQGAGYRIKIPALVLGCAGLFFSGLSLISLDAAASMLMLGYLLKNLELSSRRDAVVVVAIGFLLMATHFLYSQSFPDMLTGAVQMLILLITLTSLYAGEAPSGFLIKQSAVMMGLSLPMMLLVYLFFPRLPPLWAVPMPGQARTGVSDTITPGDIARMARSNDLVFRAQFSGPRPPNEELYWRGVVLNYFDGKTWHRDAESAAAGEDWHSTETFSEYLADRKNYFDYSVLLEPTYQNFIFTLTPSASHDPALVPKSDFRWESRTRISVPLNLDFRYYPQVAMETDLDVRRKQRFLQLPPDSDPLTRKFASTERRAALSDWDFAMKMARRFYSENYFYSLRPLPLGDSDTIDTFLFDTRVGFCSHFASAFTILMRSAGVPSRVIGGYQGGQWDATENYFAVHQYDAHAWSEVWIRGQGWVRIDPTAFVAPERVRDSLFSAVAEDERQLVDGALSYRIPLLNKLNMSLNRWQYRWQLWIVNFDAEQQSALISAWLGGRSWFKNIMLVVSVVLLLGCFWFLSLGLLKIRRREPLHIRQLQKLAGVLKKKHGIDLDYGRSPAEMKSQLEQVASDFTGRHAALDYLIVLNSYLYNPGPERTESLLAAFRFCIRAVSGRT